MLLPSWSFFCRKDTFLMTAILVFSSPSLVPLLAAFISCWTWAGEAEERRGCATGQPGGLLLLLWKSSGGAWSSAHHQCHSCSSLSPSSAPNQRLRAPHQSLACISPSGGAELSTAVATRGAPTPAGGEAAAGRTRTRVHGRKSEDQVQSFTRLINLSGFSIETGKS